MGSGTTACAARMLGHRFLGFELDPEICRLANLRAREVSPRSRRAR
jgi:DNA modification methylase